MSVHAMILCCLTALILVSCMKAKKEDKTLLLLEGELLLETGSKIDSAEIRVRILDVTRIDARSKVLAESIEFLSLHDSQKKIPFKVFGPAPDPAKSYIVVATVSVEKNDGGKKTLHRTTQSIPVLKGEEVGIVSIPLVKMD